MNNMIDNSFLIAALNSFTPPDVETHMVVFYSSKPYINTQNAEKYVYYCIKYAKRYCTYVITERFLKDNYLAQCMISPQGEIIGFQYATHINLTYRGLINNDDNINIINTPFGNFFLSVDTDIFHPEVTKIAAKLGAQIIISSRYVENINEENFRCCLSAERAALTHGVYVFDVTEDGGKLIEPSLKSCRESRTVEHSDGTGFSIDINNLPPSPDAKIENRFFEKYLNLMER